MPIVYAFIIYKYRPDILHLLRVILRERDDNLIIGILSARENFNKRQTIRDTWASNIDASYKKFQYRFVVGDHGCGIAPALRLKVEECSAVETNATQLLYENRGNNPEALCAYRQITLTNVEIEAHQDVLITDIGLRTECLNRPTVLIKQYSDNVTMATTLVSVDLIPSNVSFTIDGYAYNRLSTPLRLQRGFRGFLQSTGHEQCSPITENFNVSPASRSLHVILPELIKNLCVSLISPISLKFNPIDPVEDAASVRASHRQENADIARRLEDERSRYADIVSVDVVDIYANIARKLVLFANWINKYKFAYILKTDDDCYLNLEMLKSNLRYITTMNHSAFYWGNFLVDWPVQRSGKWAELQYAGEVYPPFAAGSGYVVTSDTMKSLSARSEYLHYYQGEDVSMGIWMASLNITYIQDVHWSRDDSACVPQSITIPNLTPRRLRFFHENQYKCGNICECL